MIKVSWYDDGKHIIRWDVHGRWSLADYRQAVDETGEMMATVCHRVDVIGDMQRSTYTPTNIIYTILERYSEIASRDSNYGISVLVQSTHFLKVMGRILNRMPAAENRFYFAATFEEAESIIEQARSGKVG